MCSVALLCTIDIFVSYFIQLHLHLSLFLLQTGSLVKVMAGDDFSSTDLHLANGDTLLVGQVAELKKLDSADISSPATMQLRHRKLQVPVTMVAEINNASQVTGSTLAPLNITYNLLIDKYTFSIR